MNELEIWPEEGTEFEQRLEWLRTATSCSAITVHCLEEGAEHATYYRKGTTVPYTVLVALQTQGYYIKQAGSSRTPANGGAKNSWVSDGWSDEPVGVVEFENTEMLE